MIRYPRLRLVALGAFILLTANVFAVFAPLFFAFGSLEARVHTRTVRFVRLRGRLSAVFMVFVPLAVFVAIANAAALGVSAARDGLLAALGLLGFQAICTLGEVGVLWTGARLGKIERSVASQYASERKRWWQAVVLPGRAIVLRLTLPFVYQSVRARGDTSARA